MKLLSTFFLLIVSLILMGQPTPEKAPVDPNYSISEAEMESMKQNGIILPPLKPAFDRWPDYTVAGTKDFPVVYDMRDTPWLTPVKGQSAGACWAYSTMGAVESRWLMLGLGEYNLSDNNLKWCHLYIPERSTWGNHWMSSAYFARRSGPYIETQDPYPGGTTGPGDCPTDLEAVYYITDSRYPPANNMDAIKQTVLETGLVWSLMYYNSSYFNTSDNTYYYGGTHEVNHAGCVIGWNDTLQTAGGTGAWIVRNTYGQGWGEGGYYYISYNDSQFLKYNGYWPNVMENEPNTMLYQYDEIGGYWGVGFNSEVGYGLVKFEGGQQDTRITKVGTFLVSAGCGVEIKIYDEFDGVLSGLLNSKDEVICDLPGYYTFDLDSALVVPAGEDFYIQIKYDANDVDQKWPIAVEDTIGGYAMPELEIGKFWINSNPELWPEYWYQIGHNTPYHYDLCIKAYAEKLIPPSLTVESPLSAEKVCQPDLLVSGTAEDANGDLAMVALRVNGGDWLPAEGAAAWSLAVELVPGINTLEVQVTDLAGLTSAIETVAVNYSVQTIPLAAGWSYISAFLNPDNPDIVDMMQDAVDNLVLMAGVDGIYAPPPFNINTLGNWNTAEGYKIKMSAYDEITFCGDVLSDNSVAFEAGASIIPVLTNGSALIADIFDDPENDIRYLLDLSNLLVYWPDGGIFNLFALEPGKGYLANFKNPVSINFPDYSNFTFSSGKSAEAIDNAPWHFSKSPVVHLIAIDKNVLNGLNPGFIGAFDGRGHCLGFAGFRSGEANVLLPVFGEDDFTQSNEGVIQGERIHFKYFDEQTGASQTVFPTFDNSLPHHDGVFVAGGTSRITNLLKATDTAGELFTADMISVFPQPAKTGVNILLPAGFGICDVALMTIEGKILHNFSMNSEEAFLTLGGTPGGVYLLRFSNEKYALVKKVVVE
jgi:C1A family cysteine protease